MLFARAVSQGVRFHCPDVFNGVAVYTEDEIEPEPEFIESRTVRPEPEPIVAEKLPQGDPGDWTTFGPEHPAHPFHVPPGGVAQ